MTYPVIGIRPIVDGRRGPMKLRESLEPQVWAMAEAAKKLFEENLCYSDGTPVKVVMADTTIGRVPETAACAEKFKKENVAITLSVTPCWCYGAETMDMDPVLVYGLGLAGTIALRCQPADATGFEWYGPFRRYGWSHECIGRRRFHDGRESGRYRHLSQQRCHDFVRLQPLEQRECFFRYADEGRGYAGFV